MRAALHAEWTKLRTVPGPGWLLLTGVGLTVALGAVASAALRCTPTGCGNPDPTKLSLTGIQLGQVVIAMVAVTVIGTEYGTGMIGTTLAAVPRRPLALAAKAFVLTVPVLVAGLVAVAGSLLAARVFMPASGYASIPLDSASTLRAAFGSVLYLALVALLSLGVATAVRDSAVAIGVVLALLFVFPILAGVVHNPAWHRHVLQISPANAGLAIQATVGVHDLPIGPWAGLGVLALWAAGALVLGGVLLQVRDP